MFHVPRFDTADVVLLSLNRSTTTIVTTGHRLIIIATTRRQRRRQRRRCHTPPISTFPGLPRARGPFGRIISALHLVGSRPPTDTDPQRRAEEQEDRECVCATLLLTTDSAGETTHTSEPPSSTFPRRRVQMVAGWSYALAELRWRMT